MAGIEGKQTLVTGAASEVGRAIVQALVAEGARVIAVDTTDEAAEQATLELGLADADEVITRGLDDSDLGGWWDLSNLIAAFYHELDAFVHLPQGRASESLPLAVDRLKAAFANAAEAEPGRVSIVVVARDADEAASSAASKLRNEGLEVRLHALEPGDPDATAKTVVERICSGGDRNE